MGNGQGKDLKLQLQYPVHYTSSPKFLYPFMIPFVSCYSLLSPSSTEFLRKKIKAQENWKVFRHTFCSLPLLSPSFSLFLLKSKRQKKLAPFPSCRFFWVSQMLRSLESWDSCLPPLFIKAAVAGSSGRQAAGAVGGRAE